jgi:hypothetical protein
MMQQKCYSAQKNLRSGGKKSSGVRHAFRMSMDRMILDRNQVCGFLEDIELNSSSGRAESVLGAGQAGFGAG